MLPGVVPTSRRRADEICVTAYKAVSVWMSAAWAIWRNQAGMEFIILSAQQAKAPCSLLVICNSVLWNHQNRLRKRRWLGLLAGFLGGAPPNVFLTRSG